MEDETNKIEKSNLGDIKKKLEKKHTLLNLYSGTFIKMGYIILFSLSIWGINELIQKVALDYITITYYMFYGLLIGFGLSLTGFFIIYIPKPISVLIYLFYRLPMTMFIQLKNIRYIPISKSECEALGISDISSYIEIINQLLLPFDNSSIIFFPKKLLKEVDLFVYSEFRCNVKKKLKGFVEVNEK